MNGDSTRAEEARQHLLQAIVLAQSSWPEVMEIVAASEDEQEAQEGLGTRFSLDHAQAVAILEMRVGQFTSATRARVLGQ